MQPAPDAVDGAMVEADRFVQLDAHPWRAVTLVPVNVVQPDKPNTFIHVLTCMIMHEPWRARR